MPQWKVLVVDDDQMFLMIISEILGNEDCAIETATDGTSAWEMLSSPESNYDFVILDRIMPGIDGLQVLHRIKADERLRHTPVIMQTGATSPAQVAEGIEAGAYYYLHKPYGTRTLLSITRSVISDIELRATMKTRALKHSESLKYINSVELGFSTIEDVQCVASFLTALCPVPEKVSPGLLELLINAVEHGNLGITYYEKKRLLEDDCWKEELQRRSRLPEFSHRVATVTFTRRADQLEFRITDQGTGFDWIPYLEPDPNRSLDPNGRGIAMACIYSFSGIEYMGNGNTVVATVSLSP